MNNENQSIRADHHGYCTSWCTLKVVHGRRIASVNANKVFTGLMVLKEHSAILEHLLDAYTAHENHYESEIFCPKTIKLSYVN